MAFHKHLKLPPFKLTTRSSAGVEIQDLHRGVSSLQGLSQKNSLAPDDPALDHSQPKLLEPGDFPFQNPCVMVDEPTHHELQSKALVKGWDQLRKGMLSAATEGCAMPVGQLCLLCPALAVFRCQECGPHIFYCSDCFCKQHEWANFFHVAEKWEVDHYVQFCHDGRQMDVRRPHVCDTTKETPRQCIDEHEVEHSIPFMSCGCEPLAITLVRVHHWPASPTYPRYAFSFKLLVALKDFCQALYFRCAYPTPKRREIYSTLIDSFEEYRFFRHNMRHLSFLSEKLDPGNVCPACPTDGGKVVYALDGLFGLPRKKSAGTSHRPAIQGSLFF